MKRILIYGDSNVWGSTEYDEHGRLETDQRWAGMLPGLLGDEYEVVAEGYPGRCAGSIQDAREQDKDYDGREHYEVIFKSATPVDLVIIALGTNDLKRGYDRTPEMIAEDLQWYEGRTRYMGDYNGKMPRFLYVLPPRVESQVGWFEMEEGARERLVALMKDKVSDWVDLDAVELTADGVHFAVAGHSDVARRVADKVREML